MMCPEDLAKILDNLPTYKVQATVPLAVSYRFTRRETMVVDIIMRAMMVSDNPHPEAAEALVGPELYQQASQKCAEAQEMAARGVIVSGITMDDYEIPLDDQ